MNENEEFFAPIVIPAYKAQLNLVEKQNLYITKKTNPKAKYLLFTHTECKLKEYEEILGDFEIIYSNKSNFSSIASYNALIKTQEFYKHFLKYEYILILQLDAVLVKDIKKIAVKNYDFIGAPWIPSFHVVHLFGDLLSVPIYRGRKVQELTVGNGGLSIRRIKKFYDAAGLIQKEKRHFVKKTPEDIFFSYNKDIINLNYPSREYAEKIFIEKCAHKDILNLMPFGYHALHKYHKHQRRLILEKYLSDYYGESF